MQLIYDTKKSESEILNSQIENDFSNFDKTKNALIAGDNFSAMNLLLKKYDMGKKIDLIYIDPPFATGGVFSVGDERTSTISASSSDKVAYKDTLTGEAFLEFLRERLILARELLSEQGSIYLHIDYKIGHYVKIIMDEIFGEKNFRNDITRIKCNPKNFARKAYGNVKDLILFYSKSEHPIWNDIRLPFENADIEKLYKKRDANGRYYTTVPLHAPGETKNGATGGEFKGILPPKGRHWRCHPSELEQLDKDGLIEWSANGVPRKKIFADEQQGKKVQDIWDFKDYQYPCYPTEKNLDLLKLIVQMSSNKDSIVMDFFAGSGTTLLAAQCLGRKWLGIDQSEEAIKVATKKLSSPKDELFETADFCFCKIVSAKKRQKTGLCCRTQNFK